MEPFPVVLAHGALGAFDEIIFLGVGVVFLVLMGISWLRSRDHDGGGDTPATTQADAHAETPIRDAADTSDPERYALD